MNRTIGDRRTAVEQAAESDTSFPRVIPASQNLLIHCYACENILFGRLHSRDIGWFAFWLERKVYVVAQVASACGRRIKHFALDCLLRYSISLFNRFNPKFRRNSYLGPTSRKTAGVG
jgi:hypothetical protein